MRRQHVHLPLGNRLGRLARREQAQTGGSQSTFTGKLQSASGNLNATFTGTPRKVVVVDEDGYQYSVVRSGLGRLHGQRVSQGGGTVDSVNVVFHISPNGDINAFDFGTCESPA